MKKTILILAAVAFALPALFVANSQAAEKSCKDCCKDCATCCKSGCEKCEKCR